MDKDGTIIDIRTAQGAPARVDHMQRFEWTTCSRLAEGSSGLVARSEEHTSELQSLRHLVCRLLLEKKNKKIGKRMTDGPSCESMEPVVDVTICRLNE